MGCTSTGDMLMDFVHGVSEGIAMAFEEQTQAERGCFGSSMIGFDFTRRCSKVI